MQLFLKLKFQPRFCLVDLICRRSSLFGLFLIDKEKIFYNVVCLDGTNVGRFSSKELGLCQDLVSVSLKLFFFFIETK